MKNILFLSLAPLLFSCQPRGVSEDPALSIQSVVAPPADQAPQIQQAYSAAVKPGYLTLEKSRNGQFFMRMYGANSVETWRTSQVYTSRANALNAAHSAARVFGCDWNGQYRDHVYHPLSDAEFAKEYPDLAAGKGIYKDR